MKKYKKISNSRLKIPLGLYGITAENFSNGRNNYEVVEEMIKSGIKIIQYREKEKSIKEKIEESKKISKLCKDNGVIFIVNDYVDIALISNADGVHVGQEDMSIPDIRRLLGPNKLIGLSTHCIEEAQKALLEDIDYIGVGPIFPTKTKNRECVGLEYLEYVEKNINLPYIAIGGIKEENIFKVLEKGAKRVSIVSEIVESKNIVKKVKNINKIMKKNLDLSDKI